MGITASVTLLENVICDVYFILANVALSGTVLRVEIRSGSQIDQTVG